MGRKGGKGRKGRKARKGGAFLSFPPILPLQPIPPYCVAPRPVGCGAGSGFRGSLSSRVAAL
jgi:hypothetical protein